MQVSSEIILKVNPGDAAQDQYRTFLVNQARRLSSEWPNEVLQLGLSGGLDSEAVACAFLESGIRFESVIMRFADRLNWHDIRFAVDFCEHHRIPYTFVDLDVLQFLESGEYMRFAREYRCISPQVATHLWLREQVRGPIVFSGQALRLQFRPGILQEIRTRPESLAETFHNYIALVEPPTHNEYLYSESKSEMNRRSILNFLSFTPELRAASALSENPFARQLETQRNCQRHDISQFGDMWYLQEKYVAGISKYGFFRQCGFAVSPKPMKYTGFENVHRYYGFTGNDRLKFLKAIAENQATELADYSTEARGLIEFNRLYRQPMIDAVGPTREILLDLSPDFLEKVRLKLLTEWAQDARLLAESGVANE